MLMGSELRLDKRIYAPIAIARTISDYRKIATIIQIPDENSILLEINDSVVDIDLLKNEFCNYVLQVMSAKFEG